MTNKSILEQALLQVQTLEEAVKQNAKGILASTMKQELNDLLKESKKEEEEAMPSEEAQNDMSEQANDEEEMAMDTDNLENTADKDEEEESSEEEESTEDEESPKTKNRPKKKKEDSFDGMPELSDNMLDDEADHEEIPSLEDDVMDMTDASDEEILKVFKAMKPEDGIVVKKDGDDIEVNTGEEEYIIKLDDEEMEESEMKEEEMHDDSKMEEEMPHDSKMEEEMHEEPEMEEKKAPKKVEATEAARTKWNAHGNKGGAHRLGIKGKKVFQAGAPINEEVQTLKKQNDEYKKALALFKEKLNEVAIFNANLAFATRLFTEHTTTKQEKLNILKRFDTISTISESKNLYNTIKGELVNKKPITESVVEKISAAPKSSSSEILAESKAYENPQFRRMKDLMGKIK